MGWWRTSRGNTIGDPPANYLDRLAEADRRYRAVSDLPRHVRDRLDRFYREGLGRPATDGDIRDLLEFCAEGDTSRNDEYGGDRD